MTVAAPRSSSSRIVGSDARMRASSATVAVAQGDVQVGTHEHPPALDGELAERLHRSLPTRSTTRFE